MALLAGDGFFEIQQHATQRNPGGPRRRLLAGAVSPTSWPGRRGVAGEQRLLLIEIGQQTAAFLFFGPAGQATSTKAWFNRRSSPSRASRRTRAASAWAASMKHRIVQQVERLQRRVRTLAARATAAGVGQIERDKLREGRSPLEKRINPAAVAIGPRARLPDVPETLFRHAGRLRRFDAGAAHGAAKQAAHGQRVVAHCLGRKPQSRLPRDQGVVRIARRQLGPRFATTAGRSATEPSIAASP